jgi:cell division control protein 11
LPFSIIGSDEEITVNGRTVRGRQYPWGAVEGKAYAGTHTHYIIYLKYFCFFFSLFIVDNPQHSDFGRLRSALLR